MGFRIAGFCVLASALVLSVSTTDSFADSASIQAVSRSIQAAEFGPLYPMGAPSVAPVRTLSLQRLRYEVYRFPDH